MKEQWTFVEAAQRLGIDHTVVVEMIRCEWISPATSQTLDEEDIARVQLILDLRGRFGANDEAIPLILHLIDQLCHMRNRLHSIVKDASF